LIDRSTLRRTFHTPIQVEGNPLLVPGMGDACLRGVLQQVREVFLPKPPTQPARTGGMGVLANI